MTRQERWWGIALAAAVVGIVVVMVAFAVTAPPVPVLGGPDWGSLPSPP